MPSPILSDLTPPEAAARNYPMLHLAPSPDQRSRCRQAGHHARPRPLAVAGGAGHAATDRSAAGGTTRRPPRLVATLGRQVIARRPVAGSFYWPSARPARWASPGPPPLAS